MQAAEQHISPTAEWIWAGTDGNFQPDGTAGENSDFTTVDSAYCRVEVSCSKHGCKAPVSEGGCVGPGPHGAPGYAFDKDPKVTYETPWTDPSDFGAGLFEKKELGAVTCDAGYALRAALDNPLPTCCKDTKEGCSKPDEAVWKFEGCCADFLWSIPATNYFVAFLAFILMSYMFIGFHIICDDFFVPALNVMCEKVGLSDDVRITHERPDI
jgi:hypothetical protein